MAKFITRIELYNADEKDYQQLTVEMQKAAFTPVRKSRSAVHHLKASEYNRHGNISLQEVMRDAYQAARQTGKEYTFTIIRDRTYPSQYPVIVESY